MKNHVQPGHRITFTAGATIVSGQLVALAGLVGVAAGDYESGDSGELGVGEVYRLPKEQADAIAQGERVTLDVQGATPQVRNAAYVAQSGDVVAFGTAWEAADGTADFVEVYVSQDGGAVTP